MKRTPISVERVEAMLKQAEVGLLATEYIRQARVTEQTIYRAISACGKKSIDITK